MRPIIASHLLDAVAVQYLARSDHWLPLRYRLKDLALRAIYAAAAQYAGLRGARRRVVDSSPMDHPGPMTFGDYMQSLVDEQNLLRREY